MEIQTAPLYWILLAATLGLRPDQLVRVGHRIKIDCHQNGGSNILWWKETRNGNETVGRKTYGRLELGEKYRDRDTTFVPNGNQLLIGNSTLNDSGSYHCWVTLSHNSWRRLRTDVLVLSNTSDYSDETTTAERPKVYVSTPGFGKTTSEAKSARGKGHFCHALAPLVVWTLRALFW